MSKDSESTEDSTQDARDITELHKFAKMREESSSWNKKADIYIFGEWLKENKKEKDNEKLKERESLRLKRTLEVTADLDRRIKDCEKYLNQLNALTPDNKKEEVLKKEAINIFKTSIKTYSDTKKELERMAKIKVGDSMKETIKDSLIPLKDKIAQTQDAVVLSKQTLTDPEAEIKEIKAQKFFHEGQKRQKLAQYRVAIKELESLKDKFQSALREVESMEVRDSLKDKIADSLKSMKDKIRGTQDDNGTYEKLLVEIKNTLYSKDIPKMEKKIDSLESKLTRQEYENLFSSLYEHEENLKRNKR